MNMHTTIVPGEDQTTRTQWDVMLAELEAATRRHDQYLATVLEPMDRYIKSTAARPNLHFEIRARSGQVARYMVSPSDLYAWDDHFSPEYRDKAAAIRDAWLAYRSLCGIMGWDDICDEQERLSDLQCEVEEKLILTPAPDRAALYWKLDRLYGPEVRGNSDFGAAYCAAWLDLVMADANRLLA